MSYIIIYKDSLKKINAEYISLIQAKNYIDKGKDKDVYVFRYSKDSDMLIIKYPLSTYYNKSKINIIKDDKDDIECIEYIELRLCKKYPQVRLAVNIDLLGI